jgi:hypothetical protein
VVQELGVQVLPVVPVVVVGDLHELVVREVDLRRVVRAEDGAVEVRWER